MSPAEVKACSVWELTAAVDGWAEAHSSQAMSEREADEIWAWMQSKEVH